MKYGILLAYLNAILVVAYCSTSQTMNTLNTYNVNQTAIAFLSNMIENSTGHNIWAASNELIDLLDQQIQLVETMKENSWQEAEKYVDIIYEFEDPFDSNENFQEYSSVVTKSDEVNAQAYRYAAEVNILQELRNILEEERRRENRLRLPAVMSASHRRVGATSSLRQLDDELLAKIALLSVK